MKRKPKEPTKCVIYCRFSPRPRRESEQTETNDIQEELCREYAEKHGWEVVEIFGDEEVSGADEEREGFWKAIDRLQRGWVLLAFKADRLYRSVYLNEQVEREVKAKGAMIATVHGGPNLDDPEQRMVRQILAAVDECRSKIDAYRTSLFMRSLQKKGRAMSHLAPYGKREGKPVETVIDGETVLQRMWEDEPKELAVLERIFAARVDGTGFGTIAKELNATGIVKRNGKPWSKQDVRGIYLKATQPIDRKQNEAIA